MDSRQSRTQRAFDHITARRNRPWRGEEEVRIAWVSAIETALGMHFDAERASKDCSYNNVIIEFKAPGAFRGSKDSAKFREATQDRLLPYIDRDAKKSAIPPADYIGIALDGDHVCFAQVLDGSIHTQHLIPFSVYAVEAVIQAIVADTRRAITSINLLADFGHGSQIAISMMQALSDALASEVSQVRNSKIKMLFEEWRALYGQVADMSVLQSDAINKEICFRWSGKPAESMPARLFVIHTYNSLLIKLLAAEIVSAYGLTSTLYPAQMMAALLDDSHLLAALDDDIEHAGIFVKAGINGFVEEAIFSWYLEVGAAPKWRISLLLALRNLLTRLSVYRSDYVAHTRDVLRDLYQGLVPGKLRQSLGEFYTPDWLVDFTLDRANSGSWLNSRVLDPTCGSGSFLLSVLRRVKSEAHDANWSPSRIIKFACENVWGLDLNPLAVQTARVNYLMEIADLLAKSPGISVEIPILLADAVYSPAPAKPNLWDDVVQYQIGSKTAALDVTLPRKLAFDRDRLDDVFDQMTRDMQFDLDYSGVERRLLLAGVISSLEAPDWREPLEHTWDQIRRLHRQNWNGIWFRIVRNFFWSATAGRFDYIVGNPPWIRWSKLPDVYRERIKPTCERYGIFSKTKRHGGNELDVSAMIAFTTADKWLKNNGRLAFVITGTLFKNPSSAGFRRFKLDANSRTSMYLSPVSVDDMKALKTFEDASNHTAVAIFDKRDAPGNYPVPYHIWDAASGYARAIPSLLPLAAVLKRVTITQMDAAPVDVEGSPWSVLSTGRISQLTAISGTCAWANGRKGITTDLNGVYFVAIVADNGNLVQIRSRPEAGKKDIGPARTVWVEPTLLYPLIKGAGDFEPCYLRLANPASADERLFTFVPNSGITAADYAACEAEMNGSALANTRGWFSGYRPLLGARSTFRRQMQGAPYYAVYNVGDYTFKPWKVVWPEMSTNFYAAVVGSAAVPVVGSRTLVPDHKIYYVGFDDAEPAYFLCGLLNAPVVREWVESHIVSIQVGDVFKHMTLPEYDSSDNNHTFLTTLVLQAHGEHNPVTRKAVVSRVESTGEAILTEWMAATGAR